jgi:probable phosphoglycerate mutase
MRIYIVRHGETEWNKRGILQGSKDSPLSAAGQEHALNVARYLQESSVKRIYASPLGRAQETAKVIADQTGAQVTVVPEFAEMNFGICEGRAKRDAEKMFADFFEQRKRSASYKLLVAYPSGESYHDVYLRVLRPLQQIMARSESCIIVGHESVNRMLRGVMLGQELEQMIHTRQKNNEVVDIDLERSKESVITVQ